MQHFQRQKVKKLQSNLIHVYIESLIRFGSTGSKLLTFLDQSRSICGWTILSIYITQQPFCSSKLYCMVTEAQVCEELARSHIKAKLRELNLLIVSRADVLTTNVVFYYICKLRNKIYYNGQFLPYVIINHLNSLNFFVVANTK